MCIDEEFYIQGNFNSAEAQQLVLAFEICRDPVDAVEKKCFDYESVIEPWMRRKFLFTLENRTLFQKDVVDREEKFLRYSEIKWNVLSPQIRQDVYH